MMNQKDDPMIKPKKDEAIEDYLSYRPDTKIIDCTIRDGGLMNNHKFEDSFVKAIYEANVAAGVDFMEFGYKASKKIFAPTVFTPSKRTIWRRLD